MAGWQDGRMPGWPDGRMAGWPDGRMAGWQDGRMAGWKYGKMPRCQDAKMPRCQDAKMARWQDGTMARWQDGQAKGCNILQHDVNYYFFFVIRNYGTRTNAVESERHVTINQPYKHVFEKKQKFSKIQVFLIF
jgi:hypothetical protein